MLKEMLVILFAQRKYNYVYADAFDRHKENTWQRISFNQQKFSRYWWRICSLGSTFVDTRFSLFYIIWNSHFINTFRVHLDNGNWRGQQKIAQPRAIWTRLLVAGDRKLNARKYDYFCSFFNSLLKGGKKIPDSSY